MENPNLEAKMERLWREVRELSLGDSGMVESTEGPLTPLCFLRDYVMPNKPCIIRRAIQHWPALRRWSSNQYLCSSLRNEAVSVHFTPHGYGDALVDPRRFFSKTASEEQSFHEGNPNLWFVTSHVEKLPFSTALDFIAGSRDTECGVAYAQQQNGCFLSEYSSLAEDAEVHIPWATEALGCMPEAVNLWIGNERAVTSFHKDHYENLYAVVQGEKHFTLLPPTDVHRLYVKKYPSAHYCLTMDTGEFTIELDHPCNMVPWVSVDPYGDELEIKSQFPRYFEGPKPLTCTVKAGEMLYLPSMWFHHVKQSSSSYGCTIALNFSSIAMVDTLYLMNIFHC